MKKFINNNNFFKTPKNLLQPEELLIQERCTNRLTS